MRWWMVLLLSSACGLPMPQAPTWEVTATIPLVARTVRAGDAVDRPADFFFGDYGPFCVMDADSVVCSLTGAAMEADPLVLASLPSTGSANLSLGPQPWQGNALDELTDPNFFRGWLRVVVRHNLPGHLALRVTVRGWDDEGRPCDPLAASLEAEPSPTGREVVAVHLEAGDSVLAFLNPSSTHQVPEFYEATAQVGYTALAPVGPDPTLSIQVSLITALDLTFREARLQKRAVVQRLVIGPRGQDRPDDDVDGDLTARLTGGQITCTTWNATALGGHASLRVARTLETLWTAPDLLVGPFAVGPPRVDPGTGRPTDTRQVTTVVSLSQDQVALFSNPGPDNLVLYAAVEYTLQGDPSQRVCVCAQDSLRVEAVMRMTSRVEP